MPDSTSAPDALARLVLAGGPLAPRRALLLASGDAPAALALGVAGWRAHGCSAEQCAGLQQPDPATLATTLRWLQHPGQQLLGCSDPAFPPLLQDIPQPPLALFVAGDASLAWHPAVAVVGSRSPTPTGRALAARFATCFVEAGLAVTSGLAAGIDAAAHTAALDAGGRTVAVIGTGPDQAYPPGNARLQARIAAEGVVLSEYPPGTPARAGQFPARNRLVAGLALATVVIEAAQRSGALITARLAAEAGREVGAVPGSVLNPRAAGCHRLIREGVALVERPEEVLELLAPALRQQLPGLQSRLATPTEQASPADLPDRWANDPDYQSLWRALDLNPSGMDSLITRCGLTAPEVSSMLLAMELAGIVVCVHGRYCRTP
ncbi:DNA-protecting protein DprA [Stenotrophomonas cyclobalanopsidis]|uniref:DNA-protecting protein DprA n=1 Tax=Stenotrophomonas cyclobalanopsidis TaxID=2771362 RepID=A0ABQ6T5E8_9GAMM|nr:DNA-processing protein DprA [Stenotrophomonas cyclobalanopsidis]KAA9004365.1 DNA-protecting protein DprA [Stenotrophomonas cyclobalanopsidis]